MSCTSLKPPSSCLRAVGLSASASLRTRVFETRTATGSELFSLLTCLHTTIFTLLSIFSQLEMISIKIWVTPLPWHVKFSLLVAVRVSKTCVLKLPINLCDYNSLHTIKLTMTCSVSASRQLIIFDHRKVFFIFEHNRLVFLFSFLMSLFC